MDKKEQRKDRRRQKNPQTLRLASRLLEQKRLIAEHIVQISGIAHLEEEGFAYFGTVTEEITPGRMVEHSLAKLCLRFGEIRDHSI